tara:strand:+ start:1092 stop:1685 length:594 start_codon:yes stop_codon:yes gene_type:complete
MSNLFKNLEYEAFRNGITPRSAQSREWFRKKAATMGKNVSRGALMKEDPIQLKSRKILGSMMMFFYDPKGKDTLPFYDSFPLVIVLKPAAGGFLGLNLHYLPPVLRAKFLDALLEVTNNEKYDDTTKFEATYDLMQRSAKFKYFKPCIKHYLSSHVRSRFAFVPAPEWEIATFLPTADFQKASQSAVYADSRRKMNS